MQLVRKQQAWFKGERCTEHVYSIARATWRESVAGGYQ